MTRSLSGKRVAVFGAGGGVGRAMARELARQGAEVFLSGRHLTPIEQIGKEIRDHGGTAHAAEVNAQDEKGVESYLESVAKGGRLDAVINLVGPNPVEYANGTPMLQLPLDKFLVPLTTIVPSQFITARTAAKHMVKQQGGVILFVTAVPSRGMTPDAISIGAAFGAIESMVRSLAGGLGAQGVRVVGLRTGPMVDTPTIQKTYAAVAKATGATVDQVQSMGEAKALVKTPASAADTAQLAAFLISDAARTITGEILNASSGRFMD